MQKQPVYAMPEFKQHVINQLEQYISDTTATRDQYDKRLHSMIDEDIAYAQGVLDQYKQNGSWSKLREALIYQDTLPREECFYYLVEKNGISSQRVGLTWKFVNQHV